MTKPPRMGTWKDCRALDTERAPSGRHLCRECRRESVAPFRFYCSRECQEAFAVKRSWAAAVAAVDRRDNGKCAQCGREAVKLRDQFFRLRMRLMHNDSGVRAAAGEERRALVEALNAEGFALPTYCTSPTWGQLYQVDHIVPVVCGGGACDLSNLQTLCTGCHRKKTKEQEAARRKPQLPLPMEVR
jgi:5-methylcytosine-specific restriction protein A